MGLRRRLRRRRVLLAAVLAALLACACGDSPELAPPAVPGGVTLPVAQLACRSVLPARALFVPLEAGASTRAGVRYFVDDWGNRMGCFWGTVATDARTIAAARYDVLVVDIGPDATLPTDVAGAVADRISAGTPVALFAQPGHTSDGSAAPEVLDPLQGAIPGLAYVPTCPDAQIAGTVASPFVLGGRRIRPGATFPSSFDLGVGTDAVQLVGDLCGGGGTTALRTNNLVLGGFHLGFDLSLADNSSEAIAVKRLTVDVIDMLRPPAPPPATTPAATPPPTPATAPSTEQATPPAPPTGTPPGTEQPASPSGQANASEQRAAEPCAARAGDPCGPVTALAAGGGDLGAQLPSSPGGRAVLFSLSARRSAFVRKGL